MSRHRLVARLRRDRHAPSQARRVLARLTPTGCTIADTAALLVSEAVSNAVLHSDGADITVAVTRKAGGTIVGAVFDTDPRMGPGARVTHLRQAEAAESDVCLENGRGLDLMDMLASSWGVSPVGGRGKWVWFQLEATCDWASVPA
ncbi:ATP-binding protein [Streptomyces sp. WAC07094]|uniref:ATP-binding protein n=1 Tax=Streptomyces sp. WAC07094 TaxID=3072183 RepID=UPI002EAF2CE2|nr:ATP-binding protein [Streptomyces sp. WAC07094]